MGTTAEKLAYLQGTKDAIKAAIAAKGVSVPDGTTFRGYAEKIGEIVTDASKFNATWTVRENVLPNSAGEILLLGSETNSPSVRPASDDLYLAAYIYNTGGAFNYVLFYDFVDGIGQYLTSSGSISSEWDNNLLRYTADIDADVYWSVLPSGGPTIQSGTLYLVEK